MNCNNKSYFGEIYEYILCIDFKGTVSNKVELLLVHFHYYS